MYSEFRLGKRKMKLCEQWRFNICLRAFISLPKTLEDKGTNTYIRCLYKYQGCHILRIQLRKNSVIMQKLVIFTGLIALVSGRGILRESCPPKPPTVLDFDAAKVRFFHYIQWLVENLLHLLVLWRLVSSHGYSCLFPTLWHILRKSNL